MGHRLGAPKVGDTRGASVSLTSLLSRGDRALGAPSLTKLEAGVVIKESRRRTRNAGGAEQQLPPIPTPGSFHPRGGSLSLNSLLPHNPQSSQRGLPLLELPAAPQPPGPPASHGSLCLSTGLHRCFKLLSLETEFSSPKPVSLYPSQVGTLELS